MKTVQEFIAALNDGALTILDRPDWLTAEQTAAAHLANAGDINAAVLMTKLLLGDRWLWHIGYDNLAVLTNRDDPHDVLRSISLSPAHALAVGAFMVYRRELDGGE